MVLLKDIRGALLHFIFPHVCSGCGTDVLPRSSTMCYRCIGALPETGFWPHAGNPVEKLFWGRLPLHAAAAHYYFTHDSLIQHLMHQFKYGNNQSLGLQLGRLMGEALLASGRFPADALVPLPLFPARERKRGYNQAFLLCKGIQEVTRLPVLNDLVIRPAHTESQTKKGRVARWKNMEGKFFLLNKTAAQGRHLLLVDDVITTGATLESCGNTLLEAGNVTLSIATLCLATR
jgi:ComF family protein